MSAYILTLLTASLAAAVVELLSPSGEGGRVAAHVRMIAGLFLLVTLLQPLGEGIRMLKSALSGDVAGRVEAWLPRPPEGDYRAVLLDSLAALSGEQVEAWVKETLNEVFSIPPEGCVAEVRCLSEGTEIRLQELRIGLREGYSTRDPHPIEDYFSEQLGCPCYVTVLF